MDHRAEFSEVLRQLGGVIDGEHPVMDGHPHRLATVDDNHNERTIFYVAYLDGIPCGYAENNRTKEIVRWKSRAGGVAAFDAKIKAEIEQARAQREYERATGYERTAQRLLNIMGLIGNRLASCAYLERKGLAPTCGAPVRDGFLLVPGYDIEGKLWTVQFIAPDGQKRFSRNSRKTSCFHLIGAKDGQALSKQLAEARVVVIAEGYATAATIARDAQLSALAAFDAGNILPVASAIRTRYPDKEIIIAGDDDHSRKENPGRTKAVEAAIAVKGRVIFPWLDRKQRTGKLTDFNDLPPGTVRVQFAALKRQIFVK